MKLTLFDIDNLILYVNRQICAERQNAHDAAVREGVLQTQKDNLEKLRDKYIDE